MALYSERSVDVPSGGVASNHSVELTLDIEQDPDSDFELGEPTDWDSLIGSVTLPEMVAPATAGRTGANAVAASLSTALLVLLAIVVSVVSTNRRSLTDAINLAPAPGVSVTTTTGAVPPPATSEPRAKVLPASLGDGVLAFRVPTFGAPTFGESSPDIGPLASAARAGAELALADINAAGGVLDTEVALVAGELGVPSPDLVLSTTETAVALSDVAGLAPPLRIAPPDRLQARAIADLLMADGVKTLSIIHRRDSYGDGVANSVKANFELAGGAVRAFVAYEPDIENFDPEVDTLVAADSEAILIVGLEESATVVERMHERGIGPQDRRVYGADAVLSNIADLVVEPRILDGMKVVEWSMDPVASASLSVRLEGLTDRRALRRAALTYDSMIIAALATHVAGSDDPNAIAAQVGSVTKAGTKCGTFADCKAQMTAGRSTATRDTATADIDYDGVGPYAFNDVGEETVAAFRIITFDGRRDANSDLGTLVVVSG